MSDARVPFADLSRVREVLAAEYADLDVIASHGAFVVFCARALGFGGGPVTLTVALGPWGEPVAPPAGLAHAVELTRRVQHPNVMPVSLARVIEGYWTYEMPLLSGRTVADMLEPGVRTPFERVVSIMQDAAAALGAAHDLGIVHGALRPSCMHLSRNEACVLSEFTLGSGDRASPDVGPAVRLYDAPEQRRNGIVDGRADQYALALIAHELLTGTQRAMRDDSGVIEIQPLEIPVGRPLAPGVPLHAGNALRKATAKDPQARFQTVAAFVESFVLGAAARPEAPAVVREPERRVRRSYLATGALVALMIASVAFVFAPSGTTQAIIRTGEGVVRWWRSWRTNVDVPRLPRDDPPVPIAARASESEKGASKAGTGRAAPQPSATPQEDRSASARARASDTRQSSQRAPNPTGAEDPDRRETRRASAVLAAAGVAASAEHGVLVVVADRGRPLVRLNGFPRNRAPLALRLRPGIYRVALLTRLAYRPRDLRVTISAGDTAYAEFEAPDGAFPDDTLSSLGAASPALGPALIRLALLSTTNSAGK